MRDVRRAKAMEWLAGAIAVLGLLPFVVFPVVYMIHMALRKQRPVAVQVAADVTTAFLLPVVVVWFNVLSGWRVTGWIIIAMVVLAACAVAVLQWRKRGRIYARRIVRLLWRGAFILCSIAYGVLWIMTLLTIKWV
ncbi:MAG: DUF3397 family protein [Paenibacillaceae bacterium]|nr:DUF3397 family protein [Paenibacillaceae bacterium]